MANITVSDIVVDGIRARVRQAGKLDVAEAVVFVHGNPGSSEDFAYLMQQVGDFVRCVAVDAPGFGQAERPRSFDYTVSGYAKFLGGCVEALGVRRAHLVLHDFGGAFGLAWGVANPDALKSVVLLNIGVLEGYRWHKYARIWQAPVLGELFQLTGTRGAFRSMLNSDNPKPLPNAFIDRMFDEMDWGMKRAVLKLYRNTRNVSELNSRLSAGLRRLDVPALVIWGREDVFLPATYAAKQKEFFASAEVHVLQGCGHWPFVDEPEKVTSLVIPFLQQQLRLDADEGQRAMHDGAE